MLMRTIAVELAPHDITVNNIAPGAVDTPKDAPLEEDANRMQQLLSEIPLRRMASPKRWRNWPCTWLPTPPLTSRAAPSS